MGVCLPSVGLLANQYCTELDGVRNLSSGFNERLRKSPACWTCWRGSLTELHKLNSLVLLVFFGCFFPWVSPLPHCRRLELFQLVHCQQSIEQIIYLQYAEGEWEICSFVQDKPGHEDNMTFFRTWKILKKHFTQEQSFFFFFFNAKPDSVYNVRIKH